MPFGKILTVLGTKKPIDRNKEMFTISQQKSSLYMGITQLTNCCWHCRWLCWFNWSFMTESNRVWATKQKQHQLESTHRPRQRKAPSRTLMINQKELERTFDCVYSQINKLTVSQHQTELLSSVSEDHKNMISDHDNRNIWRKHTHEIWHLKRGEGLVVSSSLLPQISL